MKAFAGGGRGSNSGMERIDLKHWSTEKQAPEVFSAGNRGGPIPAGLYLAKYCGQHPHLGLCAQLDQTISSLIQADYDSSIGFRVTPRGGFYLHGAGPKGSDGCIVPANKIDLERLLTAIKAAAGPVLVVVHSEGMNADKLETAQALGNVA